jgi:hypothetical protein
MARRDANAAPARDASSTPETAGCAQKYAGSAGRGSNRVAEMSAFAAVWGNGFLAWFKSRVGGSAFAARLRWLALRRPLRRDSLRVSESLQSGGGRGFRSLSGGPPSPRAMSRGFGETSRRSGRAIERPRRRMAGRQGFEPRYRGPEAERSETTVTDLGGLLRAFWNHRPAGWGGRGCFRAQSIKIVSRSPRRSN